MPSSANGIKAEGTGDWYDDCEYMYWYLYTMLTVGRFADDTGTYLGYSATGNAQFGSLADDVFHYSWNDYTVTDIYYQESSTGDRQLVFGTDRSVPNDFYIVLGDEEFLISDSTALNGDNNIRVWSLEDGPGLAEGQELRFKIG